MENRYLGGYKLFYHPDRIKAYLEKGVVYPLTIKMYLTDRCNISCGYCVYADRISGRELTLTDAKKVLKKLRSMGVRSVVLTGGEPTMYSELESFGKYARELGLELGLITNGVIYPRIFRYLRWIRISLDTAKNDIYAKMKGKDRLDDVLENLKTMVASKPAENPDLTIGTQMVVTEDNYREIYLLAKKCRDMGIDYFQVRPLENKTYDRKLLNSIKRSRKRSDSLNREDFKVVQTDYKWNIVENGYRKNYRGCPGMDFLGAVDTKADYYPCCFMVGKSNAVIGNLLRDSKDKLLKNRDKIKNKIDFSLCPPMCQGSLVNRTIEMIETQEHVNFI